MIHEDIQLTGSFQASGSFTLPNHTTSESIANPTTGSMYNDTTDNIVKLYNGTEWVVVGEQTASVPGTNIEYLLVAGGGGGGAGYNTSTIGGGGGGGAGGYLSSSLSSVEPGSSITVTVGGGGTGQAIGSGNSTAGTDSSIASAAGTSFSTVTSIGGGRGGSYDNTSAGGDGGSGGGSAYSNGAAGSGTVGQGFDGGRETSSPPGYGNGGGGGASEAGSDGIGTAGGDGGNGIQSNITGTATYYAGGGGGGIGDGDDGDGGAGGNGGGGTGGEENISGTAGTSNTGGGGGGGGNNGVGGSAVSSTGGSGGSGVAIFAYDSGSANCAGGIVGDAGNGRKYHQLNESGTFKIGSTSDFQIITESLSAHFDAAHFSSRGSSTWTDLRGNGNGSISGATLNTYYYTFDGSNDVVNISGEKITSDNMSIEVWLTIDNPSESGTYREIISQQANSNKGMFFGKTSTANQLRFGGATYNFSSINASTFTHLVVTRNSSGDVIFYENGSQGGTASGHTFITSQGVYNGTGTRIGRQYGNYTEYWDGNIAQVRFYNKTLSAAEVLQNYNATKTNFI